MVLHWHRISVCNLSLFVLYTVLLACALSLTEIIKACDRVEPESHPGQVRGRAGRAREPQQDAHVAHVLHHGPMSEHPVGQGLDGPGRCSMC